MLKIYYDRFTETCHNIFKSLIFFLPSFLFLFLVSIFSNIQKHSFFLETVIRAPFSRHSLTFRSSSTHPPLVVRACRSYYSHVVCVSSASCPLVLRAPFVRPPHCSHVILASSARRSVSSPPVLRAPFTSCPRVIRAPSATCPRILHAPSASCPRVLRAPRGVRPPYVALFHKTKLKKVPSNWYNLSLSQELFLLLCTF